MIRAILWDVGGPINTEGEHELQMDRDILDALSSEGIVAEASGLDSASDAAVRTYAPDAYKAIIWMLCRHERHTALKVYEKFHELAAARSSFQPREGIAELLSELQLREVPMGLVANQPVSAVQTLHEHGLGVYFQHQALSGTHGFRKPDVRLFLATCDALGVPAGECVMVGDRIDNDIAPSANLGMTTVLFRTGRHRAQEPRSWDEAPVAIVNDVQELRAELFGLLGTASRQALPMPPCSCD